MTVAEFWTSYLWPLIVIVAQSLLLLVLLLVSIAYVLLAHRKICAAVQSTRRPNVVGLWRRWVGVCCRRGLCALWLSVRRRRRRWRPRRLAGALRAGHPPGCPAGS